MTSISQFSDIRPTDWAYQAISNLIEGYGCVTGYPATKFLGSRPLSRWEAAAALNACLDRISDHTDALKRLLREFEKERAVITGRVDGLQARVGVLEASRFSTTTRLRGQASFVLGANRFNGSDTAQVQQNREQFGATTFNYDVQLNLDTSFSGKDLLRTTLRAGNFNFTTNSFGGAGPSSLSLLEVAFQEDCGSGANCGDVVAINRLFYQVPLGDFTVTVGGWVEQTDMLAIWPSAYPSDTVLNVFTLAGAPGAYNSALGAGAGLWWQKNGWAFSANYVAANGDDATSAQGGVATTGSGGSGTLQLGYGGKAWAIAAAYARVQNANDLIPAGTRFSLSSFSNPGYTDAVALSGYWQPAQAGWIPSISAGWGLNSSRYTPAVNTAGLVSTSQSWSVGLEWSDAFRPGNALGMAVGQPTFATQLVGGANANDANVAWEWWYKLQISDSLAVTPALFYLSRPLGADTAAGNSFDQLGGLIKTSFQF
ncbi:MAG: iron uptake porin [Vulcanococcus sp.]